MGRLAGAGCAVVLLVACQPSLEAVVEEHRGPVQGVFDQLRALDLPVAGTPRVSEDGMTLGDDQVRLDGDASNALFIRAEDLAAPENANSDGHGALRAAAVENCGEAMRGEYYGAATGADMYLAECGRALYAFVLRTDVDESASIVDDESFEPGRFEGDVLLFRLADSALLGGFRVTAANSDEVSVQVDASGTPIDPLPQLESDLGSQVYIGIEKGLDAHVPGATR
jgi:hypothetical protein